MSARSFRSCGHPRPPAAARAAHAWPRPRVIGRADGNRRGLDPFRGSRCFQISLSQREGSPRSGVSFRFKAHGGSRHTGKEATTERCGVSIRFKVRGGFRQSEKRRLSGLLSRFQSALRFAVVSDPTPWHAVLTSPVAVVLHTAPPHPLQPGGRTCPEWGRTPSQVPYTPGAVFGRSPTPLPEGVSKTPSRQPGPSVSSDSTLMPPPGPLCQASADPAGFFTSPRSAAPGPVDGPDPGSGPPPSRPRTVSRSTASPCFRR